MAALSLSSCSLFRTSETDATQPGDTAQGGEAGTDVIPAPNPEIAAAPPTDPEMPPEPPKVDDPNAAAAIPPPSPDQTAALPAPAAADTPLPPPPEALAAPVSAPQPVPPPPAPSLAASTGSQGSQGTEEYKVQPGETLMKIAFEQYGDLYQWRKILEANRDRITNPNSIARGTVLRLEKPSTPVSVAHNGDKYLIKNGDTLGTISDDVYGTNRKWRKLYENNRQLIKDPNRIFAGFHLYYVMTDQDRMEKEQIKGQPEVKPMPLAQLPFKFPNRAPASQ